jgi:UDP-2-acetamido-3-amino-2,3-dideoxy-glucuronate N-acetyltransferase
VVGDRRVVVFDDVARERKQAAYNHAVEWVGRVLVPRRDEGREVQFPPEEPLRMECQHFPDCVASWARL